MHLRHVRGDAATELSGASSPAGAEVRSAIVRAPSPGGTRLQALGGQLGSDTLKA